MRLFEAVKVEDLRNGDLMEVRKGEFRVVIKGEPVRGEWETGASEGWYAIQTLDSAWHLFSPGQKTVRVMR